MLDPDQTEPPDAGFSSLLHTADPQAARQLTDGFYAPEDFGRWTKPKFSLLLRVPAHLKPATLLVKLYIPDEEIKQLKSMTLNASVNGLALEPQTFSASGHQVYLRSIPLAALATTPAHLEFSLDKWLPASGQEGRDLGIVVTFVGLQNKPATD
jgi:hypothetical protein